MNIFLRNFTSGSTCIYTYSHLHTETFSVSTTQLKQGSNYRKVFLRLSTQRHVPGPRRRHGHHPRLLRRAEFCFQIAHKYNLFRLHAQCLGNGAVTLHLAFRTRRRVEVPAKVRCNVALGRVSEQQLLSTDAPRAVDAHLHRVGLAPVQHGDEVGVQVSDEFAGGVTRLPHFALERFESRGLNIVRHESPDIAHDIRLCTVELGLCF
mmetsp:Transcript_19659/g.35712  ORF Transcript_19659/g.35712 Transcript_19659/m.35712 type:complete len:207 (+) Transcript_19659:195-815(+)